MPWIYYFLLLLLDFTGLVLTAFTLPGLWLMLGAAAIYALLTHGRFLGWHTLIALLILAATAEIAELLIGGRGAKKAGATGWGILGGFIGAIIGGIFLTGLIPIPILGTVIGICLGTFLGAFCIEFFLGKAIVPSLRVGYGAAKGRLFGIAGKITFGIIMFLITIWTGLPVHGTPVAGPMPPSTLSPPATNAR